jgi:hypothetical protein
MPTEEAQWPALLLIAGSLLSTIASSVTDWSINIKIIFSLAFINAIHYRLHPRFSRNTIYVQHSNPAADYPSRNLWYSLVLSSSFSLVSTSFKDARLHSQFTGAGHFVQIVIDGIALLIGLSYFFANAVCVSREQNSGPGPQGAVPANAK